jgi:hypothetical protein
MTHAGVNGCSSAASHNKSYALHSLAVAWACFDKLSTSRHIAQKTARRRISKTLYAMATKLFAGRPCPALCETNYIFDNILDNEKQL